MRPANTSETSRKGALGRARLLLRRDLGWTRGFPARSAGSELTWLVPDATAEGGVRAERVGRRELDRAQWAANDLRRDFPRVFPELIGNTTAWRERLDFILDLVKGAVHANRSLPRDLFREASIHGVPVRSVAGRIVRKWPELQRAVGALS